MEAIENYCFFDGQNKMMSKIDYKEILKIIDLLEERNLSHFELEVEGFKIKIGKNQPQVTLPEIIQTASISPKSEELESTLAPENRSQKMEDNLHYITSPMVGTFYGSPDPSSPAFVEVGETVDKNQTLCIIEAMKLMNEIEADIDGIIEEIYIKSGKSVEYGQRLFAIKPS